MVNFLWYTSQSDRFSKIIIKDKSKDYGAARFYYFRTIRVSLVLITKLLHIDSDCDDVEFGFSLHLWALGRKSSFGSSWEEGVETLLIFPNERQWLPTPPAALQTLRKLRKCASSWKQLHQIHSLTMWGKLLNWRTITIKLPDLKYGGRFMLTFS